MFGRNKGKKGNYAYVVARVKAKKAQLMSDDAYQKMLLMSLPEISRFISESGYQKEITDLTGKFEGIDLVEHATYQNMARVFKDILHSATGELHDILALDLERWDIWNLKVILRGKSFGIDADSIREDLVLAGKLSEEDLEKLISLESQEEIIALYGRRTGRSIPQSVIDGVRETKNLSIVEDYLDKNHYETLLASIDPKDKPYRLYQNYIRMEVDMKNLETILKLKLAGVTGEKVMEYYISGGKEIDKKLATQLANAESVSAAVNDLAQLSFFEDIKDALDEDTNSLRGIVAGLEKCKMAEAKNFSHLYPLSVIPVIDFMIHKEVEVNNIRIVARGIESGLDTETIKGLLVI
jgi:V/A-type H+/Na+-transporting ATPase subunit C